jgi:hypothetical protein
MNDMLQENMVAAWRERAERTTDMIRAGLMAPALTEPLFMNAAHHYYSVCMNNAGYWMNYGGR